MKKMLLVLTGLLLLTGCGIKNDDTACSDGFHLVDEMCIQDSTNVGTFTTGTEVLSLFNSFKEKQDNVSRFFNRNIAFGVDMEMAEDSLAPTTSDAKNDAGSDDYSGTNNQVDGVDEMDNILTDGKYIYIQNYNKIQIVLAYTMGLGTDALRVQKEITYENLTGDHEYFYFNGMYVDDERLVIVGNSYYYSCKGEEVTNTYKYNDEDGETTDETYTYCSYYEYHTVTRVMEYSKEDFELVNEYEISGNYVGSRKIGDNIYFVTNEYIPFYMNDYPEYDFDLDNYLPSYSVNDTKIDLGYEDIMYVEGTEPTTYTTFFGINLDTKEISSEVVLGEGGYNLYVSNSNIYLTGTKWNWNYSVYDMVEEAVEDGDDVNDVTIEEDPYEISTSIVKVSIDNGIVDFESTGEVPGMALDQFAMDEHNGNVRIVTTTNNWWWWGQETEVKNRLFVLDENLDILSTLEGLGKPGESVQSTRFVGDYAYVVTFLNTDPFYVIDLSDPLNPTTLSELEIPGFSAYLQPVGEDYMLGIGFGDDEGGTRGLKISLYDISDKENAVVASEVVYPYEQFGYIWSSATYEHKDLLVSVEKGIITLPYTEYDWSDNDWSYNTGALVLNLDVESGEISERGRVLHSEADSYDIYVYKAKFIGDFLYTISSKYIMVSTIEDPETILNSVQIGESREIYYPGTSEPETDNEQD